MEGRREGGEAGREGGREGGEEVVWHVTLIHSSLTSSLHSRRTSFSIARVHWTSKLPTLGWRNN